MERSAVLNYHAMERPLQTHWTVMGWKLKCLIVFLLYVPTAWAGDSFCGRVLRLLNLPNKSVSADTMLSAILDVAVSDKRRVRRNLGDNYYNKYVVAVGPKTGRDLHLSESLGITAFAIEPPPPNSVMSNLTIDQRRELDEALTRTFARGAYDHDATLNDVDPYVVAREAMDRLANHVDLSADGFRLAFSQIHARNIERSPEIRLSNMMEGVKVSEISGYHSGFSPRLMLLGASGGDKIGVCRNANCALPLLVYELGGKPSQMAIVTSDEHLWWKRIYRREEGWVHWDGTPGVINPSKEDVTLEPREYDNIQNSRYLFLPRPEQIGRRIQYRPKPVDRKGGEWTEADEALLRAVIQRQQVESGGLPENEPQGPVGLEPPSGSSMP